MALGDFSDKFDELSDQIKQRRSDVERKYIENSDEAWSQIKAIFQSSATWIVMGIAALLIVAAVFAVKFIGAIRAPAIPRSGVVTLGDETAGSLGEELFEEIDDSNTVHPVVSGARKQDYYTFLLLGTDAGSSNTDTLMVVGYDVANQKLNLMSIPRDTMVNVSWDIKKINSVYSTGGLSGLKKHIGKLIGFVPDYYVKIDLNAFVEVVDLLGGVEFDVPVPMHYHDPAQNLNIDLEPGLQKLNGEQAMGLVRFRKSDRGANGKVTGYDDTGRVQTQQAFLKAMFKQCLSIRNWTKITGYVEIFQRGVESDLTLGEMLWFARQAMDLSEDGFHTCTIPGNYYASAWSRSTRSMQSYVTLYGRQVVALVNESFNPYLTNVTLGNLDIMSINADGSVSSSTGYVADSRAAAPPVKPSADPDAGKPDGTQDGETTGGTSSGGTATDGASAGGGTAGPQPDAQTPGTTGEPSGGTAETPDTEPQDTQTPPPAEETPAEPEPPAETAPEPVQEPPAAETNQAAAETGEVTE